ncbi:condensin complex protein MksE [Paraferrimonas sedimenticola]|uniref:DUF4194 domain-containing protein n=1 Tax=Paraferrimonas sedimenticola TaxID=375674 RepID=A0AA37RSY8_9GAMM|nr:hypothetical protein [Paraferrimonas sedimenticola]GLP95363.1 hypothetical protein GCM10007895_06690 [Paraferrimonas sedimenticola]
MISTKGRVLEALLSGQFICQVSHDEAHQFLEVDANREEVETQLNLFNRTLASASSGQVRFAAYRQLGDDERKRLTGQFKDISSSLLPLVEWLVLVQESLGHNAPLTQGDILRLHELQGVIEDSPAFAEALAKIARYALFNSSSSSIDAQLKLVFKRLQELGYLVRPNEDKQIFIATGKVDYVMDVIKYIDENERLALTQTAEQSQGDLL